MRVFFLLLTAGLVLACLDVLHFRHTVPLQNTELVHFDALIVLGSPAMPDGSPSNIQRVRVSEAVQEYQRGVAPRIIFTGGAAHNHFVEAQVMGALAQSEGVPASAIFLESRAFDTLQNAEDSVRIMQAHGWRSAEVITTREHLYRSALIFSHTPIEWRMHAAPWPPAYSQIYIAAHHLVEGLKTLRLQSLTLTSHPFQPLDSLR